MLDGFPFIVLLAGAGGPIRSGRAEFDQPKKADRPLRKPSPCIYLLMQVIKKIYVSKITTGKQHKVSGRTAERERRTQTESRMYTHHMR